MIRFNPFAKPLDALKADDLSALNGVGEGWYVEYKEEVPSATAIAKSVAAFANHHGGWIFYGIRGSRTGDNLPEAFPGVPSAELARLQERIRDAVAAHISPPPHFLLRLLRGPNIGVGLGPERAIVVVQVPLGADAPYLHSSGKIYRRVADRSDPSAETDRHVLDLLWRRGERSQREFAEAFDRDPELAQAEESAPFVTLYLLRDPLHEEGTGTRLTYEDFCKAMRRTPEQEGIPFDTFHSTPEGFVARQVAGKNPVAVTLTWVHRHDGTSIVTSPLRHGTVGEAVSDLRLFGYDHGEEFIAGLEAASVSNASWLDLNILLALLSAALMQQIALLKAGGLPVTIRFLARLQGVWRKIPFVDTKAYVESLAIDGVPVIQTDRLNVPNTWSLATAFDLPCEPASHTNGLELGMTPWLVVLNCMGLARVASSPEQVVQLALALQRGVEVYSGRGDLPWQPT